MTDIKRTAAPAPSGRFLLRVAPELHARLRAEAEQAGLSFNAYCAQRLAEPGRTESAPGAAVQTRATRLLGESLVGIIVYGSFVRGTAARDSDVDVLVVVEPGTDVTRALYRAWDAEPLAWQGRRLDVHIAALPSAADAIASLWAEIAIEGVVLSDREYRIARYLAEVRRRIAAGTMERGMAHGQPYWREVA